MEIVNFSDARSNLKSILDRVCADHTPVVISRQNGEHVVILSESDYNSMAETFYLLGNKKNADRIRSSINQGKGSGGFKETI